MIGVCGSFIGPNTLSRRQQSKPPQRVSFPRKNSYSICYQLLRIRALKPLQCWARLTLRLHLSRSCLDGDKWTLFVVDFSKPTRTEATSCQMSIPFSDQFIDQPLTSFNYSVLKYFQSIYTFIYLSDLSYVVIFLLFFQFPIKHIVSAIHILSIFYTFILLQKDPPFYFNDYSLFIPSSI